MTEINKDNKKMGFEALGANYRNSAFTPDDTAKGIMLFIVLQTIITLLYQGVYFMGFDSSGMMSYVFTFILDACFVLSVLFRFCSSIFALLNYKFTKTNSFFIS